MKLTPIFLDFETFWSSDHSLTRMTNIEYVMHPETEVISLALKWGDLATAVVLGEDKIAERLSVMDWSDKIVIGHNMSGFDALILAWRFGVKPAMWGCTLAMARPRYAASCGCSLKNLVEHFNIGVKNNAVLLNTRGRHLKDFTLDERKAMMKYNGEDTDQCAALFKKLIADTPRAELLQIDLTTRMLVEPQFEVDQALLKDTLVQVQAEKARSLRELADMMTTTTEQVAHILETGKTLEAFTREQLMSSAKFSELLTRRGVAVPMKPSPTDASKMIPALSKTDAPFLALQEHEDPIVAAAAMARLEAKSTLLETRVQAFLGVASQCAGKIPMPLRYAGASTTGRWSGEIFNPQNLPRINKKKAKLSDALRMSLVAPENHLVVTSDLSGIELRVNHFLWKVKSSMRLFRESPDKADLYREFAANLYVVPDVADVSTDQRQIGKIAHLGLGFGAGAATFKRIAKTMGGVDLTDEMSGRVVETWREEYALIVAGWRTCHEALKDIANGIERPIDPWGLCLTGRDHIRLPSGRRIWYPELHTEKNADGKIEWVYGLGRNRARIYAGKIVENIVQALARDVLAEVVAMMYKKHNVKPALLVHDEYVTIALASEAERVRQEIDAAMRAPTSWWPELIKWSESGIGKTYGEAH